MVVMDKEGMMEAYEEVRSDGNDTVWAIMGYENNDIKVVGKGSDYDEFVSFLKDDERYYGYVRVTSGDEMSKRAKFIFIQWNGPTVPAMKKAKMSVDKGFVRTVIKNCACEILAEDATDVKYDKLLEMIKKAGGANYGTGV